MKIKYTLIACLLLAFIVIHWPLNTSKQPMVTQSTHLKVTSFKKLPGWSEANTLTSLKTFQSSCRTFLKQAPDTLVGNDVFKLKAKDWHPVCEVALSMKNSTKEEAKQFFQTWFKPVEFYNGKPITGLFTGYYFPTISGSLVKTEEYQVPIYGLPNDRVVLRLRDFDKTLPSRTLVGRVKGGDIIPYYTRQEITQGAVEGKSAILAWVKSPIDRLFIEIQGSGILALPNGKQLVLGYAGGNGAPYTAIGRVLIDKGVMTLDSASMQRIRAYLEAHPKEITPVINKNKSFVFFKILEQKGALGAQGLLLTPGYSMAVDQGFVPLGTPVWLKTTRPDERTNGTHPFNRLMVAQDTGGAIRGAVRGDIYWGEGARATEIAGKMKDYGRYWLLLPHVVFSKGIMNEDKRDS